MTQKNKIFLLATFGAFLFFILLGIAAKRLWLHREWLIPCHLTAAVFLAFWGHRLFKIRSSHYQKEIQAIRQQNK